MVVSCTTVFSYWHFPAGILPGLGCVRTKLSVATWECRAYGFHLSGQIPPGIWHPVGSQASDIFCSIRRTRISCDSSQLYESYWTLHSSVICISKKICETRSDEWHTAWINPRVSALGVDTERDFLLLVSSFHQTYKNEKKWPFYLTIGRALLTHKEPGRHYFSSRKSCWHHFPSTSQQSQNGKLG